MANVRVYVLVVYVLDMYVIYINIIVPIYINIGTLNLLINNISNSMQYFNDELDNNI